MEDRTEQIKRFADNKTEQIITTSCFNGAVDLVSAGKGEEAIPEIEKLADKLEEKLRSRLNGGLPF